MIEATIGISSLLKEGEIRINSIPPYQEDLESVELVRRVYDAVLECKLNSRLAEVELIISKGEAEMSPDLPLSIRARLATLICEAYSLRTDLRRLLKRWSRLGL